MKLIIAHTLYCIGDMASHLLKYDCLIPIIYPIYNKCIIWSSDLDTEGKIWHDPKHDENR